jgi:hypothetical protein
MADVLLRDADPEPIRKAAADLRGRIAAGYGEPPVTGR